MSSERKPSRIANIGGILIALLFFWEILGGIGYGIYELNRPIVTVWVDEIRVIERGAFYSYDDEIPLSHETIDVTVDVKEGGAIDAILMPNEGYYGFVACSEKEPIELPPPTELVSFESLCSFHYITSALNGTELNFQHSFDRDQYRYEAERFRVLLNNNGRVKGGADAVGDVTVHVKIKRWATPWGNLPYEETPSQLEIVVGYSLLLGGIATVVIIALGIRESRLKKKRRVMNSPTTISPRIPLYTIQFTYLCDMIDRGRVCSRRSERKLVSAVWAYRLLISEN
jgi:hypothetical protein